MRQVIVNRGMAVGLLLSLGSIGATQTLDYSTSWFGNSFSGIDRAWVQNWIGGMAVAPDGTVFVNSVWDEGGREIGIYRDGAVLPFDPGLHGWGRAGGYAVALDAQYLYVTMQQSGCDGGDDSLNLNGLRSYPPCAADGTGPVWHAVRRYSLLTLFPVPFSDLVGLDGTMLVVDVEDSNDRYPLTGLAAHQGVVYVSSSLTGQIKVYDSDALTFQHSFPVESPDEIASTAVRLLWVIQRPQDALARISSYMPDGQIQPDQLVLDPAVQPTALAFDGPDRLLIADDGVDQNGVVAQL